MEQTTKKLDPSRLGTPLIAGRFRRLNLLGEGGMGRVYEVYDHERHRRLALKEMRCATPLSLLLFKNEFRALRDLRHENLVRLHELFESDGDWYFTLDLVEGIDFLSWVRPSVEMQRGRPRTRTAESLAGELGRSELPTVPRSEYGAPGEGISGIRRASDATPRPWSEIDEERLRRSFAQLAAGVTALHRAGKVHRDLKPSNILVETHSGRVVVLDFGVVTDPETAVERDTGNIIGTVHYMAPEQAVGSPATPASDWYAVGLLLYRALTGRAAFHGSRDLVFDKRNACFPPLSLAASKVPLDLAQLCTELLAGSPAQRPTEERILRTLGAVADARTRPRPGVFVGRAEELAELEAAHDEVGRGASRTVVVEGESGVGKSALVVEFLARLGRQGQPNTLVLRGRCHERETVPYNAFDRVIDELAWCVSSLSRPLSELLGSRACAALVMLFPALGLNAAANPPPLHPSTRRSDDVELRRRAVDGLVMLFDHLTRHGRLVIAIDDAHWADADSLSLLRALTQAFERRRVLLVLTMRSPSESDRPAAQRRVFSSLSGAVHHLRVGRLPPAQARALLLSIAQSDQPLDEEAILEEAGGHPMFLDELVRQRHAGELAYPPTDLDGALRARVRRMSPEAQHLVEYVAVAAAPIANSALARAADFPAARYDDTMDELQAARLVRFNGPQHGDYAEPYHDRVREALVDSLTEERKTEMHLQLARALEGSEGGTADVLARHYDAGGDAAQTVLHALRAAEAAAAAFAFDRAAQFYRTAIRAGATISAGAPPPYEALARVLQYAGRAREAADAYAQASTLAAGVGRLQLRRQAAEQLLMGGYVKAGRVALNEDLRAARLRELRPVSFATLLQVLWALLWCRSLLEKWRPRRESEVDPAALHCIDICWSAAAGMSMVDTVSGMLFSLTGLRRSLKVGEPFRIARACTAASAVASALGQASLSLRLCEQAEAAAAAHGPGVVHCYPMLARIVREFLVNHDLRATIELSDRFLNAWHEEGMGRGFESDFAFQFKSWAQAMRGDIARVRQTVTELVHVASQSDNRFLFVTLRTYHVLPSLADDRPDDAERDVREAIASWLDPDAFQLPHCWAAISLCEVALYQGTLTMEDVRLWWKVRRSVFWHVKWVRIRLLDVAARSCLARAVAAREAESRVASRAWRGVAWWSAKRLSAEDGAGPLLGGIVAAGLSAFDGDGERGVKLLSALLPRLEERAWNLHSAAVLRQLGLTGGGDAGAALVRNAEAWFARASVQRPDRLCRALLPGWPGPRKDSAASVEASGSEAR